jgi:cell division protein FtsB
MSRNAESKTSLLDQPGLKILATLLTLGLIISMRTSMKSADTSAESLNTFEQELLKIETKVTDLQKNISDSQSEFYLEKLQRNELLKSKEGEMVLQIADKSYLEKQLGQETEIKQKNTPWQEWMKVIKNN